jgi:CubicO group peptidase (beta-lactamase class C family)
MLTQVCLQSAGRLGLAFCCLACGAWEQGHGHFNDIREATGVPALAGALVEDGRPIMLVATGVRRADRPTPVTVNDKWHLGSDTKAMTATLVATFVDEGRLDWDDRLVDRWPELASTMHPEFRDVTIAHLLAHRAGIDDEALIAKYQDDLPVDQPVTEQRRWVAERVLSEAPTRYGEYAYSNLGYTIVGALLERLTGESWEVLMTRRLFSPLGMRSCGFGAPATPGRTDQPWGHTESDGRFVPVPPGPEADNPPVFGPAGAVHCSLRDWSQFVRLHLRAANGEARLVSAESFARMQTPWPGGDYAFGWLVIDTPEGRVLAHDGSNTMFYAHVVLRPFEHRAVMTVTNCAGPRAGEATAAAAERLLNASRGEQ